MLEDLRIAHADGSYPKKLAHLAKLDLLLSRRLGITKTHPRLGSARTDRHGARSLLITSQLPIDHWHDIVGDPTLADAILDRVLQHAYKILHKGKSMRKST